MPLWTSLPSVLWFISLQLSEQKEKKTLRSRTILSLCQYFSPFVAYTTFKWSISASCSCSLPHTLHIHILLARPPCAPREGSSCICNLWSLQSAGKIILCRLYLFTRAPCRWGIKWIAFSVWLLSRAVCIWRFVQVGWGGGGCWTSGNEIDLEVMRTSRPSLYPHRAQLCQLVGLWEAEAWGGC